MAKVLLVLAVVLVLLNGMTFLVVVNQGNGLEKTAAAGAAPTGSRSVASSEIPLQKLETLLQNVQTVNKSVGDLSRKVDELQRKMSLSSTRALPAPAPVTAAGATAGNGLMPPLGRQPRLPPSPVRKGPAEPSRAGAVRSAAPVANEGEDNGATEEAPAPQTPQPSTPPATEGNAPDASTTETPAGGVAPSGESASEKPQEGQSP